VTASRRSSIPRSPPSTEAGRSKRGADRARCSEAARACEFLVDELASLNRVAQLRGREGGVRAPGKCTRIVERERAGDDPSSLEQKAERRIGIRARERDSSTRRVQAAAQERVRRRLVLS
jgi:hypothetical protein